MMKRGIITISDSGAVSVPSGKIMMSEYEIAELLGVMVPTVRGKIQTLLKSRMCVESCGGIVRGNRVVPAYFGLEVVIAIAFQVDSYEASRFRKFIFGKLRTSSQLPIYISISDEVRWGSLVNRLSHLFFSGKVALECGNSQTQACGYSLRS